MDEYFVSAQPKPVPPDVPAITREDVERLDLSGLHEPFRPPRLLTSVTVLGKLLVGLFLLCAAALPLLLVVALFRFLDSLPW
jgi:hypothetical protein